LSALTADRLNALNRIVSLYIEYAELQAFGRCPMTMQDWVTKLDEFLKVSGRLLLDHAGSVSAEPPRRRQSSNTLDVTRYRMKSKQLKKPPRRPGKKGR
jgi:hypothetical protein